MDAGPLPKAERSQRTTTALVTTARALFAERGYSEVSLNEIVEAAGLTKGALYHHYAGKEQLFQAVVEQIHDLIASRVAAAAPDADAWTQLVAGCETFLTASTEPGVQRILLIDAPAVLGWGAWREFDAASSELLLEDVLTRVVEEGYIAKQPIAPLVQLLSGAMNQAALWIAQTDERDRRLEQATSALNRLLAALRDHRDP